MAIRVFVRFKGRHRNLLLYYIDPETGRDVSRSAKTKDQREAERAALKLEEELIKGRGADGSGWEHFKTRFQDEHLAALSKHTRKAFRTALNHFERIIKVGSLSSVSASTLSVFQAALLRDKMPVTTIASYLGHLRAAFNWAEAVGIIAKAPRVKLPKIGKRHMGRGRPITQAEFERMLAACPKVVKFTPFPWRRFLTLLWYSGLRLNEALILSWDSGPLQVILDAEPYPLIIYHAEGHKSGEDSAIPLPPDFTAWLAETPPEHRHGLVAPLRRQTGKPFDADKASRVISEIGEAAGIRVNDKGKVASAHDFRRSFGTRWAMKVRPVTLQRMMRHKRLETTMAFYVGLSTVDIGDDLWQSVPKSVPKTASREDNASVAPAQKPGNLRVAGA